MKPADRKKTLILASIGVAVTIIIFAAYQYGIKDQNHDGPKYVRMLEHIKAGHIPADIVKTPETFIRIERPMEVILALPFSYIVGNSFSFYLVNAIFFIINGIIIFMLYRLLFKDEKGAFVAGLLYYFNIIPLHFGLTILSETGSHFFYLSSIYLIIKNIHLVERPGPAPYITAGLVMGTGFLMKETIFAGMVFLLLIMAGKAVKKDPLLPLAGRGMLSLVSFLVPVVLWQLFLYNEFNAGIFQWIQYHYATASALNKFTLFRLFLSTGTAFNILLISFTLFLLFSRQNKFLALALLVSGMVMPVLTTNLMDRFVFLMFPAIMLFSTGYFLEERRFKLNNLLIALYMAVNIGILIMYRDPSIYGQLLKLFRIYG